ncbi:hypothetical protein KIN20_016201 [Parelaphostrongylus tenuis]|uniref:Protein zwilch n=1 Tax=Parelaphostrongylus tenuis TaxID=148309 RepID=A0AAD5QPL4_PARTN|nr:hypothetical protein KIN20_016201 [Parelaphostrongylus tenuis]
MAFDLRNRLMRRKLPALLDKSLLDKPICIVANAEDQLGTTFVGFHYSGPKLTTFHTRYLDRYNFRIILKLMEYKYIFRGINNVRISGRYGDHCESELRSLHQRFVGLESQRKAVASYNILDESSVFGANKFPSKMKLTFKWNEKPEDYLSPPPPSASALFHFSPGWKDKRVVLFETTEQLEYLLLMADVLDSKSVMVWPKAGESSSENVLNEVRSLIAQYRVQSNNAERTSREMRHVDFTELLWDILINALHDDNKSIMARLIHDSQSGNLMLPRLEALTPIQILLEIGIERFKRDMVQAYITAGLLTSDTDLDLKFKMNPRPQERARALLPVHLALQTMLEIKRHLNVPSHMLTKMTRLVVDKYCSTPVTDITKVFYETTVPRIQVHNDLFLKLPNLWTYEATYSCANSTVAHISVTFTRKPQLRFIEDKVLAETEITDAEDFDKRTAFLCTYTTYSCLNIEDCDGLD